MCYNCGNHNEHGDSVMDWTTALLAITTFVSWGTSVFLDKLSTTRIGEQAALWDTLAFAPPIVIYSLIAYRSRSPLQADKLGIGLGLLAGVIGSVGSIAFFPLLTRSEASTVVPLTALYPAVTAVLAMVFLRESITPAKAAGIILSLAAIYLLNK
jgi:transporter family protein